MARRTLQQLLSCLLGIALATPLGAQNLISCDSLMKLPFARFNALNLPDGFLDCMGGLEADRRMLQQWSLRLASERGETFTVGELKAVMDSVDRATRYRETARMIEACKTFYRQPLEQGNWSADSLSMLACGLHPEVLSLIGADLRSGALAYGQPAASAVSAFEASIPARLKGEVAQHSSCCGQPFCTAFGPGLLVYQDPGPALECARERELPLLYLVLSWSSQEARRVEEQTLLDWILLKRLNREVVMLVLYDDDPAPLPPDNSPYGVNADAERWTKGDLARELARQWMQVDKAPGCALISVTGEVLKVVAGEPLNQDFYDLLEQAGRRGY